MSGSEQAKYLQRLTMIDKYNDDTIFNSLKGKTLVKINRSDNEIMFITTDDEKYRLFHKRDCCEEVFIADICGDLEDLLGTPLLQAESVKNKIRRRKQRRKFLGIKQWTFYKLATVKGSVTLRWVGTSNGYYSVDVACTHERKI